MCRCRSIRSPISAPRSTRSLDRLEAFTGKRPCGWLGPGLTETFETPDLLAEAGVQYVGDWVYDDEPTVIATAHGPLVTLPYTVELNDIPIAMVQHHTCDVFLEARHAISSTGSMREGAERAKILSFAIHPYITGVPHRIKYLEAFLAYARGHRGVAFWTGERDPRLVSRRLLRRTSPTSRTGP